MILGVFIFHIRKLICQALGAENMDVNKFEILQEIYLNLSEEKEEVNSIIKNNLNRIQEINAFLLSVKEDFDFKVFSPRSEENIYRDKIAVFECERKKLEDNNKSCLNKLNKLDKQIEQLKLLIDNLKNSKINKIYDILDIQEKERQRIAKELHDSTIQNLTHLIHAIELSSMYIDNDPISAKLELETCIHKLKFIIEDMRATIFNLRPMAFDDLGFKQCIENLIFNIKSQYKDIEITYNICELNKDVLNICEEQTANIFLLTTYRVIQEALNNALKHSDADKIKLEVSVENNICLILIEDNGKGFIYDNIKKDKHFGISIMKERIDLLHGNILIDSKLKIGTKVEIKIPL